MDLWTSGLQKFHIFGGRGMQAKAFEELLMMRMGLVNLGISKYIA
jgi:hypothetical protein